MRMSAVKRAASEALGTSTVKRATWEALGTSVVLQVTDPAALAAARLLVERELEAIDRACSRFRSDSDLTHVNDAGGRAVRVDPLLIEAMGVALRAAELTDGDVDPTIGAALEFAGYDRDWSLLAPAGEVPAPTAPLMDSAPAAPLIRARVRAGWRTVELDPQRMTIRVPAPIRLDLGATAKAWAADRAAAAAAQATRAGVLVSLGGDIATSGAAPEGGWRVHVTDDHRNGPSAPGQTIAITSGGVATSSTAVRRWSHEGATRHHIIDPGTQAPVARTWRTASVAAASCVDANIASTAALVRAADAPAWLQELGLPARLVDPAGRVRAVGDWPAEPGAVSEASL
jgi:thiamine biosynthesis lipoprotein